MHPLREKAEFTLMKPISFPSENFALPNCGVEGYGDQDVVDSTSCVSGDGVERGCSAVECLSGS